MNLVRFIGLLFVFIGVLVSCAVTVALLVLMLRFWPALLVVLATLMLFHYMLQKLGVEMARR